MRGPAWCLGAGLVMGFLVAGALGGGSYSATRVGLAAAVAAISAWVVARTFDDGSSRTTSRYLAALIGALVLPAVSLGAD